MDQIGSKVNFSKYLTFKYEVIKNNYILAFCSPVSSSISLIVASSACPFSFSCSIKTHDFLVFKPKPPLDQVLMEYLSR